MLSGHIIVRKLLNTMIEFKTIIPTEENQTKLLRDECLIISFTELIGLFLHSSDMSEQSNSLSLTLFLSIETGLPEVQLKCVLSEQYFSSDSG